MKNKKGQFVKILLIFVLLFLILIGGLIVVFGSSIVNWVFDIAVPELTTLGTIGDFNATEAAAYTITPVNTIVQNMTWLTGVIYVMMLVFSVVVAVTARANPNRWLIGFYFLLTILLIFGSILISNIYEDFYDDTDEFASILKEHTLLSYMILYSPMIFTIIIFLTGIIIFSGKQEEGVV